MSQMPNSLAQLPVGIRWIIFEHAIVDLAVAVVVGLADEALQDLARIELTAEDIAIGVGPDHAGSIPKVVKPFHGPVAGGEAILMHGSGAVQDGLELGIIPEPSVLVILVSDWGSPRIYSEFDVRVEPSHGLLNSCRVAVEVLG